jgi:hypothetical protein
MTNLHGLGIFEAAHEVSTLTILDEHTMKFLLVRAYIIPSGTVEALLRFNDDSSASYSRRQSANGAADTTNVSATSIDLGNGTFTTPRQFDILIVNKTAKEKLVMVQQVGPGTAGAANAPTRLEQVGKFVVTVNQIMRVSIINAQSGEYAAGSRIINLGGG